MQKNNRKTDVQNGDPPDYPPGHRVCLKSQERPALDINVQALSVTHPPGKQRTESALANRNVQERPAQIVGKAKQGKQREAKRNSAKQCQAVPSSAKQCQSSAKQCQAVPSKTSNVNKAKQS